MQELLTTNPNSIPESAWTAAQHNGQGTIAPAVFPYPMTFVPIPYHLDTSLPNLLSTVIPMARSLRTILIIPRRPTPSSVGEGEMQVDAQLVIGAGGVQRAEMQIQSEGLLLYVSQATYEPGTGPLSTWVPTQFEDVATLDLFERYVNSGLLCFSACGF
jgi:snurportin-1